MVAEGEPAQSDGNASFLRAARAGNVEKVVEYLKGSIDINTSNANGLNALHLSSKEGHVSVVIELVKRGANVNAATKKGNTALHIASLAGQEEVVKFLVRNGANVNVQSQNGFTPLYMAAQENHDAVVKFLLANGASQSLATEDGFTPLAVALQQGHDKVVAVLLENDAKGRVRLPALHIAAKKDDCKAAALLLQSDHDPDVTSKSGFTPLHIAAHYGNEKIGALLLEKNADVNYSAKHQITPLHVAAKWGKSSMVTLLVDKGGKIDASTRDGLTPLHCAARSGHDQVVDLLLERGAPITAKTKNGLAPLHMASQGDHVDGARILLYHKAPVDDVTVDYLTALHVAAHCGHVRVAKLLLDRKADANARALNGFTPLHIACKKNRIKVVELLLKHGASIEATTESGLTPLHVASFMGSMNIVIYLIQHGANPDVPTVRGETPLHLAARANQSDIIRILLRNGAHVDASAREHQTPLHIAARLGNVDIVGLLLQHGAAVDATTKDMYTALHIAAKEGQEEVASVLLDHGASLTATTKKGFTPLHLAAKYGNIKVARLLLQKDAPVDSQGKNGVTPLHVAAHYDHVNVALLLLDKGAYPHATAKNGYTPLHIAAKKNQMDIATTLLEYGAKSNAESKAGFTPLHLAAQEGHTDMTTLLLEHHADPGTTAKNLLTPLHLCAQEDRVNVAAILVKNGVDISPHTKAGYTPLHVACHFGQINMIRFLLQHGADVNATTSHGYTPLHQAAQQGHTLIINLLLEHKASPNTTTSLGQTALSIAQRLGYVSVVETLKIVTETTVTTTTTTVTEEKYTVVAPETMQETFMSDSEDEGGDDIEDTTLYGKPAHATHVYLPYIEGQRLLMTEDTMLGDQSFRYLTADEMKSLGDDSLPIDVTRDEKMDSMLSAPLTAEEDHLTPQHIIHHETFSSSMATDNIELARAPVHAGFLVSFMVDARGGAMRGCRHSGVRVIIPPRKAPMPMRITCRYLRKEKLSHPPPLMEGEACASRILEVGPAGAKFLGPVILEVPHFAAMRGREREITIMRSDNGETWREHTPEASDDAVHDVFNESFEGEELTALDDLNTNRITRILTTDFPQYFAIITRIRQEVHGIGPEGGMVSSTVVPQVQAIFPEGALTKKIKVGLQAQPLTPELVTKMLGNRVAVSPIVTVEPRRRKFHKPITLTIPVPQAATKGMINQYSGDAPTLRLLCSITGGSTKAQWEDVTGSTPLTFVNDCVSFTTTVSARFWLMDCRQVTEATKFATELYKEAIHVPFMAKFVVFAKRHDPLEAQLRVFCMTDDKEDKTLESQEHFSEVAKSRDVEVLEAKYQFLEFAGNLVPVTKSGEQLSLTFQAFRENRLPFTIRVKDPHMEPLGRVAFMREQRVGRGEPPQTPICNLNIVLPDAQLTPVSELVTLEKKYGFVEETGLANPELIHRADLRLSDIAKELRNDWVSLALQLDISMSDINSIRSECPDNANQQALVMLRHWLQRAGAKATGNSLEKALRKINREDIVNQCMFNVELVTDDVEKAIAKVNLDQSGFDTFKEELGSSRDTSLRRDASLNGTLDDRDIMKEAESAAETSSESSDKEAHFKTEMLEQQTMQETESEEQDAKEEDFFVREAVRTPESTLVEQTFQKTASETVRESFIHEVRNGHVLDSIIQEDEKSEPTTATISSEATAELEISSSEEKPTHETHSEKDCSIPPGMKKALQGREQRTAPASAKMTFHIPSSNSGRSNIHERTHNNKDFVENAKTISKKVSFEVNYRTLSPPPVGQKKKKGLVRQGSWPPASIPGQKSKKKKQKKYIRALRNGRVLSPDISYSDGRIKDSYEWLLLQAEPEPFAEAPLAAIEDFDDGNFIAEEIPFLDSKSLQFYVDCKPRSNEKKAFTKQRCGDSLTSRFTDDTSKAILCDGNNLVTQELARTSAMRKKAALRSLREHFTVSTINDESLSLGVGASVLIEDFSTSLFEPPNSNHFSYHEAMGQYTETSLRNINSPHDVTINPKSILKKQVIPDETKPSLKNGHANVKSVPLPDTNGSSQKSNKTTPPVSASDDSQSGSSVCSTNQQSQRKYGATESYSVGLASPLQSAIPSSSTTIITNSKTSNKQEDEEEKKLSGQKIAEDEATTVGKSFLKSLTEYLSEPEGSTGVISASIIGQSFLKTLSSLDYDSSKKEIDVSDAKSSHTKIPASVVGQSFLKSLVEQQQASEPEPEQTIPASVVGQTFLKTLITEQSTSESTESKDSVPAAVIGQAFLKSLLQQSSQTESQQESKPIPAGVVGQTFLKTLISEQSTPESTESKDSIPATVVGQAFLKSLLQQSSQTESQQEVKPIPAGVVGQVFLKSLEQQSSGLECYEPTKAIPANVLGQAFLKCLMEQSIDYKEENPPIPSTVVGQTFLKSHLEQPLPETEIKEEANTIPATVVGQAFLKYLAQQPFKQESASKKIIPANVLGQAFLKTIVEQTPSADECSETKEPIPASVVCQTFLKSLVGQSSVPAEIEPEKPIPASVVGQAFLKSLFQQSFSDEHAKKADPIPSSVVGQAFLKSLMTETSSTPESSTSEATPGTVGQLFPKSPIEQTFSDHAKKQPIPASVIGQTFLNALAQQSLDIKEETNPIPAAVVGQAFLKSLVEQAPEGTPPECIQHKEAIPSAAIGQAFLKSLMEQVSSFSKTEADKPIPASVVGQTFLKTLTQQLSPGNKEETQPVPAAVVGQSFLKSLVEQASSMGENFGTGESDSGNVINPTPIQPSSSNFSQDKPIPAPVLGQSFLKSLIEHTSTELKDEGKTIPSVAVGQAFLKSLIEQSSPGSQKPSEVIPASVVGQSFLQCLVEQSCLEHTDMSEPLIPANVVEQMFLKSLIEQTVSKEDMKSMTIPASVVGQTFLKSLVQERPLSGTSNEKDGSGLTPSKEICTPQSKEVQAHHISKAPVECSPNQNLSSLEEKIVPAATVGQVFLKSLMEQQHSVTPKQQTAIPSNVIGQAFLKALEQESDHDNSHFETPKATSSSVVGQLFLKSLIEQLTLESSSGTTENISGSQQKTESTIPAAVLGQTFLKSLSELAMPEQTTPTTVGNSFSKPVITAQPNTEVLSSSSSSAQDRNAVTFRQKEEESTLAIDPILSPIDPGNVSVLEWNSMPPCSSYSTTPSSVSLDLKEELFLLKNIWKELFILFHHLHKNKRKDIEDHSNMSQQQFNHPELNNYSNNANFEISFGDEPGINEGSPKSKQKSEWNLRTHSLPHKSGVLNPRALNNSNGNVTPHEIAVLVKDKQSSQVQSTSPGNLNCPSHMETNIWDKMAEVWQITEEMQRNVLNLYGLFCFETGKDSTAADIVSRKNECPSPESVSLTEINDFPSSGLHKSNQGLESIENSLDLQNHNHISNHVYFSADSRCSYDQSLIGDKHSNGSAKQMSIGNQFYEMDNTKHTMNVLVRQSSEDGTYLHTGVLNVRKDSFSMIESTDESSDPPSAEKIQMLCSDVKDALSQLSFKLAHDYNTSKFDSFGKGENSGKMSNSECIKHNTEKRIDSVHQPKLNSKPSTHADEKDDSFPRQSKVGCSSNSVNSFKPKDESRNGCVYQNNQSVMTYQTRQDSFYKSLTEFDSKMHNWEVFNTIYAPPDQFQSAEILNVNLQMGSANNTNLKQAELPQQKVSVTIINELLSFTDLMENIVATMKSTP